MQSHVQDTPKFLLRWGFWAVIAGAMALVLVFAQLAAPSFEVKPSAATAIGEIAGEIKRSAWKSLFGLKSEAPATTAAPSFSAYLAFAAPVLGIIAIVLSLVSGVRKENWRYSAYGVSMGVAAVVFQYFWWLALLVAGIVLLVTIIENIGEIFSF
jgi:hypothetical protein